MTDSDLTAKLDEVRDAIASAVDLTWKKLQREYPSHTFFAFALSTIDDAIYVSASANSIQNHQEICERAVVTPNSPDEEYYQWSPCEWGDLEFVGTEFFQPIDSLLAEIYEARADQEWGTCRDEIIQGMIEGLSHAANKGVFGADEDRENVTLFVTIYDSFDAEKVEDDSARALNSKFVYHQFSNRYAATKKAQQAERDAQQARRDALSTLPLELQPERCIEEYVKHLLNPLEDRSERFKREQEIQDLMIHVGRPMVIPIIETLADGTNKPIGNEGYAMMKVIGNIEPEFDDELHSRLAALLIQYCKINEGRAKWQVTPFHIANLLHNHFGDHYPDPSMAGNNALRDHEQFVEVARNHV